MIRRLRDSLSRGGARRYFWVSSVVALLQTALCARLAVATPDYGMTVAAAWVGALYLAWQKDPQPAVKVGGAARALGAVAVLLSLVVLAALPLYRAADRLLPLLAGLGLTLFACGPRAWVRRKAELSLLALPILNPLPAPLRDVAGPTAPTTWCAMAFDRAFGYPMMADHSVLRMPGGSLDVVSGCSGVTSITRLGVLAVLLVALFPMSVRQKIGIFAGAVVVGFFVNAARVGLLGVAVLRGDEARFDFWHVGSGATLFAVASTALAGVAWWWVLRFLAPRFEGPRGHVAAHVQPEWFDRETPAPSRAHPH